jgi:hypothetical protein
MPQTGPQTLAYLSQADEVFYGGSAGGGKSDLLLGLACTAHRKSLILRREATQLKELTDRLQEIAGGRGKWRSSGYGGLMRDLPGGRQIELSGCEFEDDKRKYQGRPHDAKLFDELPNFTESQFDFICAWNRTVVPGQRCRRVGAGNPPTNAEGEWVIRRWGPWIDRQNSNPAKPAEIRWFARIAGKEVECESGDPFDHDGVNIIPFSRTFVPALLSDNPILAATGYGDTLANLPEPLRSQLLGGDFTAGREDHEWQLIPTQWVIDAQRRWTADGRGDRRLDVMGIDVARGGRDSNAFAKRYGNWFARIVKIPGKETPDGPSVAGKVLLELSDPGDLGAALHIDVIAVGSSPYDSLKGIKVARLNVWPINFAESSNKKDRAGILSMRNVRAEAYWTLRESLDPKSGDNLALPPDPEVLADLTAPRWSMTTNGVLVEPKEDIIKRIGRSPDVGDAIAMAMLPVRRLLNWKLETFN